MMSAKMKMFVIRPKRIGNYSVITLPFWHDKNNVFIDLQGTANSHLNSV
jgi:hypothetical protein